MARKTLDQYIDEQRKWMDRCGGTLAGYIEQYGVPGEYEDVEYNGKQYHVPTWAGNGGEAIYHADNARLQQLIAWKNEGRKLHPRIVK